MKLKSKYKVGDKVKFIDFVETMCKHCKQHTGYDEKERRGVIVAISEEHSIGFDCPTYTNKIKTLPNGDVVNMPYISDFKVCDNSQPNVVYYDIDVNGKIFNEYEDNVTKTK